MNDTSEKVKESIQDFLWNNEDLVKDSYKGSHPLSGHCYVASESFFHVLGGYDNWDVYRVKHEGVTHWFLKDKESEEIVDLTKEQFESEPPYDRATKTGFLTEDPSKRAEKVINYVKEGDINE